MLKLFFAHKDVDRGACESPVLAYLVFKIAAVRLFNPLGQVAEEYECGYGRTLEHGYILYLHELALVAWRRVCGNVFLHHGVELRRGHGAFAVLVDLD